MKLGRVIVEATGAVRSVTLDRAEKRNAMDAQMLDELAAAFNVTPPPEERVTVIRANGTVFCAGLDLKERGEGGPMRGASPIEHVLDLIEHYPLPVVGVVRATLSRAERTGAALRPCGCFDCRPVRNVARTDRPGADMVPREEVARSRRPGGSARGSLAR
ncbi:MAG: enoyl-CoA hydratase/isomerase family protein [Dehalococcoidia bacterium]|nr:enoyl-CoA hydratase/isomerase family protein [Dehalococcoidia bacterium]